VVADLYEVQEVVRSGGMGLVYRVRHREWGMELAVKAPRPALLTDARSIADFLAEAQTWVELGLHPHIASCVYVRNLDGLPYVFAEWVDGGSLAEWVRDRRLYRGGHREALARALDVAIQFAWGLEYAHQQQLVHQDVKPANVLLTTDATVKVTDFGLAKARAAAGESTVAPPGASVLVGFGGLTPAYCSPEQAAAAHGAPVSLGRATDVWSWAVSVLEMFAGGPPTAYGQAAGSALEQLLTDGPADPDVPPMPSRLAELLRLCLTPEPGDRPRRMGEVADRLIELYRIETGHEYGRGAPAPARLLADSLSNQALSLLDLGQPERAVALWDDAVAADPQHPQAVFNGGLWRWRQGRQSDVQLLAALDEVRLLHPDDVIGEYLQAQVHLERGDPDSARRLLEEAARRDPDDEQVRAALAGLGQSPTSTPNEIKASWAVSRIAMDADGTALLTTSKHDALLVWDLRPEHAAVRVLDRGREAPTVYRSSDREKPEPTVALSADGRVALSTQAAAVRVWDVPSGRVVRTLTGHTAPVGSVALSRDGRVAVAVCTAGLVLAWDAGTGERIGVVESRQAGDERRTRPRVELGANGRICLVDDGYATRVRAVPSGALLVTLSHTGIATLGADGRLLLTQDYSQSSDPNASRVVVTDLTTGRELSRCSNNWDWGRTIVLSDDGRLALTGSTDGAVRVWQPRTGRCVRTLAEPGGPLADVALRGDGARAVAARTDGTVLTWSLAVPGPAAPWAYCRPRAAAELAAAAESTGSARERAARLAEGGEFAAAGRALAQARAVPGYERAPELLEQWRDLARFGRRGTLRSKWVRHDVPDVVRLRGAVTLSPDGATLLTFGPDITTEVVDVATGRKRGSLPGWYRAATDLSADHRVLLTSSGRLGVMAWSLPEGRRLPARFRGHKVPAERTVLSADGRVALTAAPPRDATVRVWDLDQDRCVHIVRQRSRTRPALTPDGRLALIGSDDGIEVWDPWQGLLVRELVAEGCELLRTPQVSPDGRLAVATSIRPGTLLAWRLDTGELVCRVEPHQPHAFAIGPDSSTLLLGSYQRSVQVWDLGTGDLRHTVEVDHEPDDAAGDQWFAASADGRLLLTCGEERTAVLHELDTGRSHLLEGHPHKVQAVSLSADGRFAAVGCYDGTVRIWEFDWDHDFPDAVVWDEAARPHLDAAVARGGTGSGTAGADVLAHLQRAGLGWISRDGVLAQLDTIAASAPAHPRDAPRRRWWR
jgi:WD40 repeat protein/serine/threonine protein kinase